MMPTLGWKVWTSDSIYNSVEHSASELPPDIQVIMYYHPDGYRTISQGDDFFELDGVTLVGKEMDYDAYMAIVDLALNDMEAP